MLLLGPWLLISISISIVFSEPIVETSKKLTTVRHLPNDRNNCVSFDEQQPSNTVVQLIDPENEGLERLVVFLYKSVKNNVVYVHVPNKAQQYLISDRVYKDGDILIPVVNEATREIFKNNPNVIYLNREQGKTSLNDKSDVEILNKNTNDKNKLLSSPYETSHSVKHLDWSFVNGQITNDDDDKNSGSKILLNTDLNKQQEFRPSHSSTENSITPTVYVLSKFSNSRDNRRQPIHSSAQDQSTSTISSGPSFLAKIYPNDEKIINNDKISSSSNVLYSSGLKVLNNHSTKRVEPTHSSVNYKPSVTNHIFSTLAQGPPKVHPSDTLTVNHIRNPLLKISKTMFNGDGINSDVRHHRPKLVQSISSYPQWVTSTIVKNNPNNYTDSSKLYVYNINNSGKPALYYNKTANYPIPAPLSDIRKKNDSTKIIKNYDYGTNPTYFKVPGDILGDSYVSNKTHPLTAYDKWVTIKDIGSDLPQITNHHHFLKPLSSKVQDLSLNENVLKNPATYLVPSITAFPEDKGKLPSHRSELSKWVMGEIDETYYKAINVTTLEHKILEILLKYGITAGPDGVLTDGSGAKFAVQNLDLRPIYIGDSVEYEKVVTKNDKKIQLPRDLLYKKLLVFSLIDPPTILGIIPIGTIQLSDKYHQIETLTPTSESMEESSQTTEPDKEVTTQTKSTEDWTTTTTEIPRTGNWYDLPGFTKEVFKHDPHKPRRKPLESIQPNINFDVTSIKNKELSKSYYQGYHQGKNLASGVSPGRLKKCDVCDEKYNLRPNGIKYDGGYVKHKILYDKRQYPYNNKPTHFKTSKRQVNGIFKDLFQQKYLVREKGLLDGKEASEEKFQESEVRETAKYSSDLLNLLNTIGSERHTLLSPTKEIKQTFYTQEAVKNHVLVPQHGANVLEPLKKWTKRLSNRKRKQKYKKYPDIANFYSENSAPFEDPDFRIIGGAAATFSGMPISNRGRAGFIQA